MPHFFVEAGGCVDEGFGLPGKAQTSFRTFLAGPQLILGISCGLYKKISAELVVFNFCFAGLRLLDGGLVGLGSLWLTM